MRENVDVENVNPYGSDRIKGEQVKDMFDSIAPAYDFMNKAMSLGMHLKWRDKALDALRSAVAVKQVSNLHRILDIATGTGDVAFRLSELFPDSKVVGADLSEGMLAEAREKLKKQPSVIQGNVSFQYADCLALPFSDGDFSIVTVAYGVRNFEHLLQGLREMRRVLAPGGVLCVIELSVPENWFWRAGYKLYTKGLVPAVGRLVSGDKRAYSYLPESIAACPQRGDMAKLMHEAGFNDVKWKSLTFGVVTYYIATVADE